MEIESSDFDGLDNDEMDDIIDDDLSMESVDDPDENYVMPEKGKYDVRRRLEQYFEDMKLRRELDLY